MCTFIIVIHLRNSHFRNIDYLKTINYDPTHYPVNPSLPLSLSLLRHLEQITKKYLHNNFISAVLTMVGAIVSVHYQSILKLEDEGPLFLC